MEVTANLIGLLSTVLLAVPAVYGAWVIYRASRVSGNAGLYDDEELESKRQSVIEEILNLQNQWNLGLAFCLFGGLALAAASYGAMLWHLLR
jgi:hypothetical protein